MDRDEIIATVGTIILAIVVLGSFIWLFFNADWSDLTDTNPAERTTYTQQAPRQKTEGHCSILADKCIVDEWSPKCLWFDCIVDGRGK
jgi:hypothetical protein